MAQDGEARTGSTPVQIPIDDGQVLDGDLGVPRVPRGLIVFAHGSGSSRHSPRNQMVARALRHDGFATLLVDLLTADEAAVDADTAELRFDIDLLAERVVAVIDWARARGGTASLPLGVFGASTGAAAALAAAAARPGDIRAVVSRGGRPDLAADALELVEAPTLLIVGEDDEEVLALNEEMLHRLHGDARLAVVPGASHLFEEAGALEAVAGLASAWFHDVFTEGRSRPPVPRPAVRH